MYSESRALQALISSKVGGRNAFRALEVNGVQAIVFTKVTCVNGNPALVIISSSSLPEGPTNGSPTASSASPGASPTNTYGALYEPRQKTF